MASNQPLGTDVWGLKLSTFSRTDATPVLLVGNDSSSLALIGPNVRGVLTAPPQETTFKSPRNRHGDTEQKPPRYQRRTVTVPIHITSLSPRIAADEHRRIMEAVEASTRLARLEMRRPSDGPIVQASGNDDRTLPLMVLKASTPLVLEDRKKDLYRFDLQFHTDGHPMFEGVSSDETLFIPLTAGVFSMAVNHSGDVHTPPQFDFRGLNGGVVVQLRNENDINLPLGFVELVDVTGDFTFHLDPAKQVPTAWPKMTPASRMFEIPPTSSHLDVYYTTLPTGYAEFRVRFGSRFSTC